MGQTRELIGTLKAALKSQGKTYADVARELGLAEASGLPVEEGWLRRREGRGSQTRMALAPRLAQA